MVESKVAQAVHESLTNSIHEPVKPVNEADANQFTNLMEENDPTVVEVKVQETPEPGMGDKILEGLSDLKAGMNNHTTSINESVAATETMSHQELLKLQLEVQKLGMTQELMAKTAGKSTQNLDTLLKSQ
ncbi:EscI/YscI/HrpB family type III secretion system inner rod protein [Algicola sagamiensis]|uniref:EscI/YscI/HrpB family type III secretion system inner rod protein n=1 Tax=Algicola sagamiensis TaxID=163869 RepID=UPI00035F280D|nr:EscI/YscI/HrpB family type III secretion system inner rod protein [Algicola sagamiensis]